jgi:hypothetical protein
LICDDADRDAIALLLMRYRDWNGQGWADIIDLLRMYPAALRRVVRVLGEMSVGDGSEKVSRKSGRFATNPQHCGHSQPPTLLP